MTADPQTVAFYQTGAADYAGWSQAHGVPGRLKALAAALAPGAAVLDLGCGAGWAARWLHDQGFRVTALDPAEAQLAPLRAAGIDTVHGDALALIAHAAFDAIWANASLQHMPRADMAPALDRIAAALKPGGRLALAIHEGESEMRDSLGRLYVNWTEAALTGLLADRGLRVTKAGHRPGAGFDGRPITVLTLDARRDG